MTSTEPTDPVLPGVEGIAYGGDYNPEQWPEEVWADDVRLMTEAGVNLVTVGVFSWARLQPAPGDLTAEWLDRVLDLLLEAGVRVDLATATASPPAWLIEAHPEILPVTADGRRLSFGARQHYCPSAPAYRDAAVDLAERMGRRYAGHPALELWHVGNEYGCHVPACYCAISAEAFRRWLQQRYGDLDALNDSWATTFWSQGYTSWSQVGPPRTAPTFPNPGQQLDFAQFSSDELLACYLAERAALATVSPATPVTTNFMGLFRPVDQFAWSVHTDVVSVDSYPDPADPEAHVGSALVHDLTRSVGGGRPWLLMEQASSAVNWRPVNTPKAPGQFRELSLQAVARGADGVLSFQWRASRAGAEKFHSGMVPHAGTGSRVWREVVALGADLRRLSPVAGTRVRAEAAIMLDWRSWWALELDSHPSSHLHLADMVTELYRSLYEATITVDFVPPEADLSAYSLVVIPSLYLVSDTAAQLVDRWVHRGGTALITFFSGIVDERDHIRLGGYPAPWTEMLGLHVEEFAPFPLGGSDRLEGPVAVGSDATGHLWRDAVQAHGAEPLLTFADGLLAGGPAALVHDHGAGTAYYLATLPDRGTLGRLVLHAARRAGVRGMPAVPAGVEAVRRGNHLFLINHLDHSVEMNFGRDRIDLLTGQQTGPATTIGPRASQVVEWTDEDEIQLAT